MPEMEKSDGERNRRRRNKCFTSFAQETTVHGIPNIHRSKSIHLKVFWIVMLLLCGIAVVYEIYKVIGDYLERPILTVYDWKKTTNLSLPQVAICSENLMINFTKLQEFKIHPQIVEFVKSSPLREIDLSALSAIKRALRFTSPDYFTVLMQPTQAAARAQLNEELYNFLGYNISAPEFEHIFSSLQGDLIALFSNETVDNNDNITDYFALHFASWSKYADRDGGLDAEKFFNDFFFDLDQVLPYCEFMGEALQCADIAKPFFSYASGTQCFLIDVNQNQFVKEFGLRMVVNANSASGDPTFPSIPEGFEIWIGRQHQNLLNEKLRIPTGTVASILLKPTHYNLNINKDNDQCVNDVERMALTLPYSEGICQDDCSIYYTMVPCNCSFSVPNSFLKPDFQLRACKTIDEINQCRTDIKDDTELGQNLQNCYQKCRPLCEYWDFSPSITYNNLPSKVLIKNYLRSKLFGLDITGFDSQLSKFSMDDLTILEIRFADISYAEVSQKATTTFDGFISQIGGIFGLFLGASLISFVQIASFLALKCCFCCTPAAAKPSTEDDRISHRSNL